MLTIKDDKFYCSRCKAFTNIENEEWDEGCQLLSGDCTDCGKTKVTFTNAKGSFQKKSTKELASNRIKRKERTLNRKAKELLRCRKKVQQCVRKYSLFRSFC